MAKLPRPSLALAALALALLLGLQPVSTDIYLPGLPRLQQELNAPMQQVQLTMSALMLSFGIGQLGWGPVADRMGRRPVVLLGLALYTLASIGCATAPSIEVLVMWRMLQGGGLAAAVVVARAMLRDLYEPAEGARVMALALSGLGFIAMAAPILGGVITAVWGWRAALWLVVAAGAALWIFVAWKLPETLVHRNPQATALGPLLASASRIVRHPTFVAWTMLVSCTYGGLFAILAGSSFVYIGMLHLSPTAYGAAMASGSLAYLLGTLVCRRWLPRLGLSRSVQRGSFITLTAGVLVVALALAGALAVAGMLVVQWLYCFAHGINQPCAQAGAVGPFPRAAGTAAALAGFVLALTAFGVGSYLGATLAGEIMPFALCLGFWSLATAAVGWTLVRRLPE